MPLRLTSDASTSRRGYTLQPMSYQITLVAASAIIHWLGAETAVIVYDQTADLEDYTEVVAAVVASAPDVLYASVYTPEGGLIAKAMHASGTDVACLADHATYDTTYPEIAGIEAAQACPVVGVPTPGECPGAQPFLDAYAVVFDTAPGARSPYTYDAIRPPAGT